MVGSCHNQKLLRGRLKELQLSYRFIQPFFPNLNHVYKTLLRTQALIGSTLKFQKDFFEVTGHRAEYISFINFREIRKDTYRRIIFL